MEAKFSLNTNSKNIQWLCFSLYVDGLRFDLFGDINSIYTYNKVMKFCHMNDITPLVPHDVAVFISNRFN